MGEIGIVRGVMEVTPLRPPLILEEGSQREEEEESESKEDEEEFTARGGRGKNDGPAQQAKFERCAAGVNGVN